MSPAIERVPIGAVIFEPQQREIFGEEKLAGLAQSIEANGVVLPLLVRREGTRFLCIDGERRCRAAKLAGLTEVPVIIEEGEFSPAETMTRQLLTAVQKADLMPVERAKAIDRLMREAKWSATQVGGRLGISPASVCRSLALLVLPEDAQRRVDTGKLAASTAYEIAKIRTASERTRLLEAAALGGLTRDAVTGRRRSRNAEPGRTPVQVRPRSVRERVVIAMAEERTVTFTGPPLTVPAFVQWMEELLGRVRTLEATSANVRELAKALRDQELSVGSAMNNDSGSADQTTKEALQ